MLHTVRFRMAIDDLLWEVARGDRPDGGMIELWDRRQVAGGLALEVVESPEGHLNLVGHGIAVALEVTTEFLGLARAYFAATANDP